MTSQSSNLRQGNLVFLIRPSFVLVYAIGAVFMVALTTAWRYESPGWLSTTSAGLTAYSIGFLLIVVAWQRGIVRSVPVWTTILCGKFFLSYLLLILFWVGPMSPDLYRIAEGNHLDMSLYDYHAAQLAITGWEDPWAHLNFTWLSFGVVGYAAIIYTIFGTSILHIAFFNSVIALMGVLALIAGLNQLGNTRRQWQAMGLSLFFPYGAYFDALVSKDVLSNALFFVGFLLLARSYISKGADLIWQYLPLVLISGLLAMVRVNLAVLFLAAACIVSLLRASLTRFVFIGSLGLFAWLSFSVISPDATKVITNILSPSEFFGFQQAYIERVTEEGASTLKVRVAEITIPKDLLTLIAFSPIRLMLWFYNPYPEILPSNLKFHIVSQQYSQDPELFAGFGHILGSILSTWLLCLGTPFLFSFYRDRNCRTERGWIILAVLIIVPSLFIANFAYVGGKRYRLLIEPLVFAACLWSIRYSRPSKYILPFYFLIFSPLLIYAIISYIWAN